MTIPLRVLLAFVLYTGLILAASFALGYVARGGGASKETVRESAAEVADIRGRMDELEIVFEDIRFRADLVETGDASDCHFAIIRFAQAYADLQANPQQPGSVESILEDPSRDVGLYC